MSTIMDALEMAKAEGAREERSKQRKVVAARGKVLSLMRSNGEWLAVVSALSAKRGQPVLSKIVPIDQLKGSARRKVDRWVRYLA